MVPDSRMARADLGLKMVIPSNVNVLISAGSQADKQHLLGVIQPLSDLGVSLFATEGTHAFLLEQGVRTKKLYRISDQEEPNIGTFLSGKEFDLVVNILTGDTTYDERSDAKRIRSYAQEQDIVLITDADRAYDMLGQLVADCRQSYFGYTLNDPTEPWNLTKHMQAKIRERGLVVAHAHLDKAYTINPAILALANRTMEAKWDLFATLKRGPAYSDEALYERIDRGVGMMIRQGVTHLRTFIDAETILGLRAIQVALKVRERYKGRIIIEFAIQPLEGLVDKPEAWKIFVEACGLADVIGGLPSRDRPRPEKHLDMILRLAQEMGKPVDVHVDQQNTPDETDTELLARKVSEHGLEGRVRAVHCISLAAHPESYQKMVTELLMDAGIRVVICPRAALGMRQRSEFATPTHNSIAPFMRFLEAGIPMEFGPDNIRDPFQPDIDGDMLREIDALMAACRYYDFDRMAELVTDSSSFTRKE